MDLPETLAIAIADLEATAERRETPYRRGKVVWRIWGQGPNLLLLHGNFGAWTHWIRNIRYLADRYRLIVPDMPGSGDSAGDLDNPSIDSAATAIVEGIRAIIGDEKVSIAGFSSGGIFGGAIANQLGQQAAQLVFIGTTTLGLTNREPGPFAAWRRLASEDQRREAHRQNLGIIMLNDLAAIDDLAIDIHSYNAEKCTLNSHGLLTPTSLLSYLQKASCRFSGIWGELDSLCAGYLDQRLELFRSLRADSQMVVIKGAGHWVLYETPDKFNGALIDVLDLSRTAFPVTGEMQFI